MPTILVQSPVSVTVDGVNFGAVADTIKNNPALASGVQRALETWFDDYKAQAEVALSLAKAGADATIATKDASLTALSAAVTQARAVILDEKVNDEETVKALKAQIDEFDRPEIEKKEASLDAQISKLQAEKDALRSKGVETVDKA